MSEPLAQEAAPVAQVAPAPAENVPVAQDAPKTFDASYVEELRKEAAKYRKELKDVSAKVAAFEQAQMTEAEKLQKAAQDAAERAQSLEQSLRLERGRNAVLAAAGKVAGLDPDLAAELLTPDKLEYDDDGRPKDVKAQIEKLVKRFPHLVAAASGSPANPARDGSVPAETDAQKRQRIYTGVTQANDIFDAGWASGAGGGVVWTHTED